MNNSSINRNKEKNVITIIFIVIFILSMIGCMRIVNHNSNEEPTKTLPFIGQPEPHEPFIQGSFSGLVDDELITLHIQGIGGNWGTGHGNGEWESIISNAREGEHYVVTAEVPGYRSSPASYTIIILGKKAYLVEDGQVTSEEALKLDFQFIPIITPTD